MLEKPIFGLLTIYAVLRSGRRDTKTNPAKALCELVIDHYKYIYIRNYPIIELVNNYKYLYYWLIGNKYKQNREAPLL